MPQALGLADNLVINFSEAIQKGTGNLVIKKLSDNSVVETIAVTAANVTVSGSQLTINPTADLGSGTDYYVEIANGAIKDMLATIMLALPEIALGISQLLHPPIQLHPQPAV
jgi:hypothetical protein